MQASRQPPSSEKILERKSTKMNTTPELLLFFTRSSGHKQKWSCSSCSCFVVDRIAELKAAIEELNDILANSPPSYRDPDEVCAHRISPLAAISIWLVVRHFMSHSPLGRLSCTGSTTIAPRLLRCAKLSAPICSAMSLHAKLNADLLRVDIQENFVGLFI